MCCSLWDKRKKGNMKPLCVWWIKCLVTFVSLPIATNAVGITVLEGDVYVEGVFSLHTIVNNTCIQDQVEPEFVQNMESIRWTFQQLNKFESNLYGKKIGLRVHTTCRAEESAENVGLNLAIDLRNSTGHIDSVGVIGPDFSSEAEALSRLLSSLPEKYRLLQLGFDTTSASLKDKSKFRNFFRTISPDNIQVKVMNLLVQELDWTYMAIIYDNDTYGRNGVSELLSSIKSKDVCFPYKIPINTSLTQVSLAQRLDVHLKRILVNANISGILVFGSFTLGTAILNATEQFLERNPNSTSPVFLFSEGSSNLDNDFKGISKGAFAVSPPRRTVEEFIDYWTDIFTNIDTLYKTVSSNVYIKLLYENTFSCKLADSRPDHSCGVLSKDEVLNKLKPSLYHQYAIQAAMTVVRAVKEVHKEECGTKLSWCDELFVVPRQRFIDVFDKMVVKFDDDFTLRVKAFKNPDLQISFKGGTDILLPSGYPSYEVYNHQQCGAGDKEFCFKKVAMLSGEDFILDKAAIKDYSEDGEEETWPNIRKPQCPNNSVCKECLPEYTDELYFVQGDMYIIGTVPVHIKGTSPFRCGDLKPGSIDVIEAIRFAIEEAKSVFQNRVPKAKIGFIIIDSCNDPQVIQEKILTLYRLGVYKDGDFIPVRDKILGYIGGWGSAVSVAIAEIGTRLGFVQIGYGCTAQELSKRYLYPFFLRTSAPDNGQADTMVKIVKYLGYNLVQILYSQSTYGEGGRDLIIEAIKRDNNKICVAQTVGVSRQTNTVDIIDRINTHTEAKVILMFVRSFDVGYILPVLNNAFRNNEYLFIASEGWGTRNFINNYTNLKGAVTLTSETPVNKKFQDHMKSLKPDGSAPDPWLRPYMEYTFGCYYEWSYNKSSGIQCRGTESLDTNQNYKIEAWVTFVERAVFALLIGAYTTLQTTCGSTESICENFNNNTALFVENVKNVVIKDDLGRSRRVFDDNGDGLIGFNIYTAAFSEAAVYEHVGSMAPSDGQHSFQFNAAKWRSITGTAVNSTCGNQPVCKACFLGNDRDSVNVKKISSGGVAPVFIVVIAVLSLACIVLTGLQICACYRHGFCIRTDNGKFKLSYFNSSDVYERTNRVDGYDDRETENYDVIRIIDETFRHSQEASGTDIDMGQTHIHSSVPGTSKLFVEDSVGTQDKGSGTGASFENKEYGIENMVEPTTEDTSDYMKPVVTVPSTDGEDCTETLVVTPIDTKKDYEKHSVSTTNNEAIKPADAVSTNDNECHVKVLADSATDDKEDYIRPSVAFFTEKKRQKAFSCAIMNNKLQ